MVLEELVTHANTVTDAITTYVVTPLLIFFVGIAAGKLLRNLLRSGLAAVEFDEHAHAVTGHPIPATELVAGIVAGITYTIASVWALREAGILLEFFEVVGVLLGIFAILAIALGLRDFLPNYVRGRKIRSQKTVGDTLRVEGIRGEVTALRLLDIIIRTDEGETVSVPYRTL